MTLPAVGASTCASGSQVWNGKIGTLTAKPMNSRMKAIPPSDSDAGAVLGEVEARDLGDAEGQRLGAEPGDQEDADQHERRAGDGVQDELEGGVLAPGAAPDADDQEHRDQLELPEQEEQEQVDRR